MNAIELGLASLSVSSSVIIVLGIVGIGWLLVWKIFLSRFKLVRELLGQINDNPDENQPNRSKTNAASSSKGKKLRKE